VIDDANRGSTAPFERLFVVDALEEGYGFLPDRGRHA
jgi:hypothetical protein